MIPLSKDEVKPPNVSETKSDLNVNTLDLTIPVNDKGENAAMEISPTKEAQKEVVEMKKSENSTPIKDNNASTGTKIQEILSTPIGNEVSPINGPNKVAIGVPPIQPFIENAENSHVEPKPKNVEKHSNYSTHPHKRNSYKEVTIPYIKEQAPIIQNTANLWIRWSR